jgi:tetratricopeptide (TPR) repeat protein
LAAAREVEPERAHAQLALAMRQLQIGKALVSSGDFEAAHVELARALELQEALSAVDPESRVGTRELAGCHEWMSFANSRLGNHREALRHASKSLELRNELAKADPEDAQVQGELARAYWSLGSIHHLLGDYATARKDYLSGLEIRRKLEAAHPNDFNNMIRLVENYNYLGSVERMARDYEAAASWYQHAYDILHDLESQRKLNDLSKQNLLAKTRFYLTVCRASGQAIDDLDFALAQAPPKAAALLFIRSAVLASRGQHVLAAEAAEKLRALDPKNMDFLYDAACGYALCVASIGQGKSPGQLTAEEAAAGKRYAARAIETLSAAVQLGYKDAARIESDIDFAAIRQEEGYHALIARLRGSLKRSKEK